MTNPDYRHYLLIIDRSGSMGSIKDEAQNGIRFFVRKQAALPGRATLTLCQFDDVPETVYDFTALEAAASYELAPRSMTALLDACGQAITETGKQLAALAEEDRPGKVIVLIATDGMENASHEYTRERVRDLITQQRDRYGWQFSYIGANVDASAEAEELGIAGDASLDYAATSRGTDQAYAVASASAGRYVKGQSAGISYTDEEREAASDASGAARSGQGNC